MPSNPLLEVFGYPVDNLSPEATTNRSGKLCPFQALNCTKSSAEDPIGVCSTRHDNANHITCPIRFRQDNLIIGDAARFFFPEGSNYRFLTEVRLHDRDGISAGNIDIVLIQLDEEKQIVDFGALEIQAVYISGNVRKPFAHYMTNPLQNQNMAWDSKDRPRPDYLSSSRKRLAPQLLFKGGIFRAWGKKSAVAVHSEFFRRLPELPTVDESEADLVWLIYDLIHDPIHNVYRLQLSRRVFTTFSAALDTIAIPKPGELSNFVTGLQNRVSAGRFLGEPQSAGLAPTVEPQPRFPDNADKT